MRQYYVLVNKQQQGPIAESALVEGFRAGTYPAGTLVWCEGMADWSPIESLSIMAAPAAAPAPAPVAAAPAPVAAAPAAQAPTAISAISGKAVEAKNKTVSFFKEKKWQQFTKKQWTLIGACAGGVLVLLIALWLFLPKSFNSDEDVKNYLDDKVESVSDIDSKMGKEFKKSLSTLKKGLKDSDEGERCQPALAAVMASFGEKGAMVYFFEKKGFSDEAADAAYIAAASNGHVGILKYLKKHVSDEDDVARSAFGHAARYGQLKVCKYLVEDCGVDIDDNDMKDRVLMRLVSLEKSFYKDAAKELGAMRGREMDPEDLMENVADVAKYLIEKGAEYDSDRYGAKEALKKCPNSGLKDLLD